MKKRKLRKIWIIILLLVISSFSFSISYARYVSEVSDTNEIRVAKYGTLNLVEKLDGVIQVNNLSDIITIEKNFSLGDTIDKEVYVEYENGEISSYLFLMIDGQNWQYDENLKEFSILNNNSKLLTFNLNDDWTYLNSLNEENKFIFFCEVDVNEEVNINIPVMNGISTGMICINDIEYINDSHLKFNAYSIQKNDNLTVKEAWEYLTIE